VANIRNSMGLGRGLTSMVIAYALVLQTFFAFSLATQAAIQNPSAGDTLFVICAHDDANAQSDTDKSTTAHVHCPLCTVASFASALTPDPALLPLRVVAVAGQIQFALAEAGLPTFSQRAGLSRAPPSDA